MGSYPLGSRGMAHTTRHLPGRGRVGRVGEGWGDTRWGVGAGRALPASYPREGE